MILSFWKREFEEAQKELQLELDKGVSIDEIRKKITKGEIQTKVSRKPFIVERIQRKKRDVIELINKNVIDTTVRKVLFENYYLISWNFLSYCYQF